MNMTLQKIKRGRLSDKEYWNSVYAKGVLRVKPGYLAKNSAFLLKMLIGKKALGFIREYMIRSYADYLLWEVIYEKYLPKTKGLKVLEIGSAPGEHLVKLHKIFGFIPYGIDYSESGTELNRKTFALNNINPDNVIYADFISEEFHKQYKGYFDIVISNGFIEHFTDTRDIVDKHINLLVRGGYLVVSIPNFRGVNYLLGRIFHRWLFQILNINIMQKERFSEIFTRDNLSILFCNYYGTFDFGMFVTQKTSLLLRLILFLCNYLQFILNMFFRVLLRDKGLESSLFSPYLIYIGRKNNI